MKKDEIYNDENENGRKIKKVFKEIYFDEFEDTCEDFTDALYDLVPSDLIGNELKKIRGIKSKNGKFYSVEKVATK